mmetsp:Transcript_12186/g.18829  ORF Transcript_12186/g.18829 Transcript_12186/m.18829 type:complete len:129 (-) Transcript_12186:822-1208(-)
MRKRMNTTLNSSMAIDQSMLNESAFDDEEEKDTTTMDFTTTKKNRSLTFNELGKAIAVSSQQMLQQKLKKKNQLGQVDEAFRYPTPVYDPFLQAFVVTRGSDSFFLDLNGNFDPSFRKIQWGNKVLKV